MLNTKFQAAELRSSGEKDFKYSLLANTGTSRIGPFSTKLVKDILASKPNGSKEEDILIFFYVFLWLKQMTRGQGHSGH